MLGTDRERAEAALTAYGPFEGDLDVFVHARAAQTAAWSAFASAGGVTDEARTRARLAWLRQS